MVEKICLALAVQKNACKMLHYRNRGTHGLIWNQKGSKSYRFAGYPDIHLEKNELVYLPMYSDYKVSGAEFGGYIIINFLLTENLRHAPFKITPENPAVFTGLFKNADLVWNAKSQGYLYKTASLLHEILYHIDCLLNSAPVTARIPEWLVSAKSYIEENYYKIPIRISKLAAMSGVSEAFFRRRFKAAYGTSPYRYYFALRMRRALELLESDSYLVKDIALMCGYENEYHFSLDFKKYYGASPSKYL